MDHAALNQLFASSLPRLRKKAARLLPLREDGEDALQDALLLGYRKLGQFKGRSQFSTWMHAILVNAARSFLRRQKARPKTSPLEGNDEQDDERRSELPLVDPRPNPEEQFREVEASRFASELVGALPKAYQPVVWLCDVKELGMKETARRLGRPLGTIKAQRHRAHRLIREQARHHFASQHTNRSRLQTRLSEQRLAAPLVPSVPAKAELRLRPSPIPKPLWGHTAYQMLQRGSRWKQIRREILSTAGNRCAICGADNQTLKCQGIWSYDDKNVVATLTSFGAFCAACAAAGEIGRPIRYEPHSLALSQLCRVNGITLAEAKRLTMEARNTWKKRNERNWRISVAPSLLSRYPQLRVLPSQNVEEEPAWVRFPHIYNSVFNTPLSQPEGGQNQTVTRCG
jgi:RNA polymerase sigma factor (sigma-70 family)